MKTNTILLEQPSRKIETERMLPLMSQVETITKQSKEPNTKLKEDLELLWVGTGIKLKTQTVKSIKSDKFLERPPDYTNKLPFVCERNTRVSRTLPRKSRHTRPHGNLHHNKHISVNWNKDLQMSPGSEIRLRNQHRLKNRNQNTPPHNRFIKTITSKSILDDKRIQI